MTAKHVPNNPKQALHYAGHIISSDDTGRFPKSMEKAVAESITDWLEQQNQVHGFGSLASGADLMIVEQLLQRNLPATIILPFPAEHFIDTSVRSSGEHWIHRFKKVVAKKVPVVTIFDQTPANENLAYGLTTLVALGAAKHLSQGYQSNPLQLTVWDEAAAGREAGTYADQMKAKALNFQCYYVNSKTGKLTQQTDNLSQHRQAVAATELDLMIINATEQLSLKNFCSMLRNGQLAAGWYDFCEPANKLVETKANNRSTNNIMLSTRLFALLNTVIPDASLTTDSFDWSKPPKWIELCL